MTMRADSTPTSELPPEIRRHFPFASRFMRVNGHRMHYVDEGEGDPVLLLYGNPTWSSVAFICRSCIANNFSKRHCQPTGS